MLSRLFGSSAKRNRVYAAPPGTRIYAIGDIHGRADLLRRLHGMIGADIEAARPRRAVAIYLGDYVDRGDGSRAVLDLLLEEPLRAAECVYLRGNHEEFMLRFLEDASVGDMWLRNGGDATVYSYGVGMPAIADREERFRVLHDDLAQKVPAGHLAFLRDLRLYHAEGDYAFVHAGIRPGRPLDAQVPEDVLWIRGDFLSSRADHGRCIVHGHSIADEVDVQPNRIGIDTGAYFSGRLTCLVLDGESRAVLQT